MLNPPKQVYGKSMNECVYIYIYIYIYVYVYIYIYIYIILYYMGFINLIRFDP